MPDLQTQGFWQVWLLEDPTVPITVVLLAAIVCYATLRKSSPKRARVAVTVLLFIALFNYLLTQYWKTTHEQVASRTQAFVDHASSRDALKMASLMLADATVTAQGRECLGDTPTLLDRYEKAANQFKLREHAMSIEAVEVKGDQARVLFRLTTAMAPTFGRDSVTTTWLFTWQRDAAGQWKLATLDWRKLGMEDVSCGVVP
jgi:hypothetical protein